MRMSWDLPWSRIMNVLEGANRRCALWVPLAWGLHFVIKASRSVWEICVPVVIVAAAAIINSLMLNDWRAKDTMNLETFEKRTSVGRNIRIDRR